MIWRRSLKIDWEQNYFFSEDEPAAKGRLDQGLGVGLLHLGEYVEVLVEAPASQSNKGELNFIVNFNCGRSCWGKCFISFKFGLPRRQL